MINIIALLLVALLAFTIWSAISLLQNRRLAIASGLPYVCIPVYEFNILYFMISTSSLYTGFVSRLPFGLGNFHKYVQYDWRWKAKHSLHKKHGDVFITVSPRNLVFNLADPAAVEEVFNSRARFVKPTWQYDMLNIYNHNVLTSEDEEWVRHRRYTSRPFTEKNNHAVWSEALEQAQGLITQWTTMSSSTVPDPKGFYISEVGKDTLKLAIHVLSSAGFGVSLSFQENKNPLALVKDYLNDAEPIEGFRITYREAIKHITGSIMGVLVTLRCVPKSLCPILPPFFTKTFNAYDDLGRYMSRLIEDARAEVTSGGSHSEANNLLYSLVRNSESAEDDEKAGSGGKNAGLSDADIKGNVFIFIIAGHETSGATLEYALVLIALYREKQAWLQAQVDEALQGESENPLEWSYKKVFPKLAAPLAIMLETLRMFAPVPVIPKWVGDSPQTITVAGKPCHIPARSVVNIGCPGIHYNPKYWPDPYTFKPERWIPAPGAVKVDTGKEMFENTYPKVIAPIKGSFMAFSDGVRGCLGQKFAQVEFVAVFASLMREWTIELVPRAGETVEECDRRIAQTLEDSSTRSSLMIRAQVELRMVKRRK
ncbi:putative P450 monooxygenase [Rhizina undulata]